MSHTPSDSLLAQISEHIASQMGLRFPKDRWRDLEKSLVAAARTSGYTDTQVYIQHLLASSLNRQHIETLARHLSVGETYFFREEKPLKALETHILPELIRSRRGHDRRLRIWCAGCSSGEEPYTIAMMLDTLMPDLHDWNVTILATDINPQAMQKAAVGVYREWSMRAIPPAMKQRYFVRNQDGFYELSSQIKQMVTFSFLNLADDTYPSLLTNTTAMDVILCRNLLIYFDAAGARHVVDHLHRSLIEGGWLIVSPAEASHSTFSSFITVKKSGAILYKKAPQDMKQGEQARESVAASAQRPFEESRKPTGAVLSGAAGPAASKSASSFDAEAEYRQAVEWYERGRYEPTRNLLLDIVSRDGIHGQSMALLARTFANQGNLAEAVSWCERAMATDTLNPGFLFLKATILQEQKNIDETIRMLRQVLYLDHTFVLAHVMMSNLDRRQGNRRQARKHRENALTLLGTYHYEAVLPESDGMTAGRMQEILLATGEKENVV